MQRIVAYTAFSLLMISVPAHADTGTKSREAGRKFFSEAVVPKLVENGCPMCHAVGHVQPNVMMYDDLLPYLAMGDAAEKTPVLRKIANLRAIAPDRPTHPGGQRCDSLDAEPCKSITDWWRVEFGNTAAAKSEVKTAQGESK